MQIMTPDKNILRKQLQAGYQARAAENLRIARIWFPIEEEASQEIAEDFSTGVNPVEL